MSNQQEFNFIIDTGFLRGDEQETFFDGDEIDAILPAHADMGDILVAAGVFTSKGQARKAGWEDKWDIPFGWSDFTEDKLKPNYTDVEMSQDKIVKAPFQRGFGKLKKRIFILKPDKSNLEDHGSITLPDGRRVDGVNPKLKQVNTE